MVTPCDHKPAENSWVFQEGRLGRERAKGYMSEDPPMRSESHSTGFWLILLVIH